jgi:hypothetical protein
VKTAIGQSYVVVLDLFDAEQLDHNWLVGAMGWKYPDAAITSIDSYQPTSAAMTLKWMAPGEINVGDTVTSPLEGISLPGGTSPYGVVKEVVITAEKAAPVEPGWLDNPYVQIGTALSILAVTAWLSRRVKHAQLGRA